VEQMLGGMGVPFAGLSAVLVTFTELLGGLALVLGAFTRLAAIPLVFAMGVAIVTAHLSKGFFAQDGGFEYPLVLLAASAALALTGSGALAVDNLLARRRSGATFGAARTATA
jgi:putative oxidoreductase